MSFLNLMGNKLKPKEVNEVLEELTNAIAQLNNIVSSLQTPPASRVTYDNTDSGLTADNAQSAIDEVSEIIDEIVTNNRPTLGACVFDVTVADGGYAEYVKSGNIVFVCYSFTISTGATSTSQIFSGLPKAKTINNFTFIPMFDDTSGVEKKVVIQNGTTSAFIKNNYGRVLENSGNYVGAFTYIAE